MRYIVFTDIDDTLRFDGKMNERNVDAIMKARENGHLVFINTGRSTGIIYDDLMHGLFDGIVASIGGEVYIGKETLTREVFETEDVLKFGEEFLSEGRFFVLEATVDSPVTSVRTTDGDVLRRVRESGSQYTKIYVEGSPTKEQIEKISKKYQLFIHPWYFEFTTKGCTKATGMEKVLKHVGLSKENCIAIGDSINDMEMLKASGIPVCVANAVDSLKEISVYQTCHAKDGALYDCFEKFGLI